MGALTWIYTDYPPPKPPPPPTTPFGRCKRQSPERRASKLWTLMKKAERAILTNELDKA